MRKASLGLIAFTTIVAVIGCGGSGGGNSASRTADNTGVTATGPTVGLPSTAGLLEVSFLTGAGRAVSNVAAQVGQMNFNDELGNYSSSDSNLLSLTVASYGGPLVKRVVTSFDVTKGLDPNSRKFSQLSLPIDSVLYSNDGTTSLTATSTYFGTGSLATDVLATSTSSLGSTFSTSTATYPAYIRTFPGRISSVTVRMDENMLGINSVATPGSPIAIFEDSYFRNINGIDGTSNGIFQGVLSDYLEFDVSGISAANLPTVTDPVTNATVTPQRIYFSGDNYAVSGAGSSGNFYELQKTINTAVRGKFSVLSTVGGYAPPTGGISPYVLPGTYSIQQIDPSDPTLLHKLISLQGIWRDYTKIISNMPATLAISLPGSLDSTIQDFVLVHNKTVSGVTKVSDMYFGYIDTEAQIVRLYPIANLVSASASSEIDGNISALYAANGGSTSAPNLIRSGVFTIPAITFSDGTAYAGGSFIVYR